MAKIPSNCPEKDIPAIGFIAHVDTSPDASGDIGELEFENFNAAAATITIQGRNVHPGYAKGKMEFVPLQSMEKASQVILNILTLFAE